MWAAQLGGPDDQAAVDVATDDEGRVWVVGHTFGELVVGGTTYPYGPSQDGFIAAFDADGAPLWVEVIGGTGEQSVDVIERSGASLMVGVTAQQSINALGTPIPGTDDRAAVVLQLTP